MLIAPAPPVPIVTVDRPTQVSAYGSGVLFSKRDPASGRFKLWYTETGRPPAPLPVADRSVPFDADLGPGAHGHFLAVYSRCEREPRWDPVDEDTPPNYSLGRGCDLYELDLTTERERRLPRPLRRVLPAVWKDGLAFARVYTSKKIVLYHRTGSAASRRMPGGPANGRPNGLDLYGRRLAFGWEYPGRYDGPASDLRMDDVRHRPRAADRALPRRRADDDLAHRARVRGRQALLREALPGRRERLPGPRRADPGALLDRRAGAREDRRARTSGRRAARA